MNTKRCFKCGKDKPRTEFYTHRRMADGLLGKCKDCTKAYEKERRRRLVSQIVAYEKRPDRVLAKRQSNARSQRRARVRNPAQIKARKAVANALQRGKLQRGACEVCGATKVQGHHEDYARPLEVRWLCFRHHRELHGQSLRG
jgi:hypothetical protein